MAAWSDRYLNRADSLTRFCDREVAQAPELPPFVNCLPRRVRGISDCGLRLKLVAWTIKHFPSMFS